MATTTAKATSNPGTPRAAWVSNVGGRIMGDEENFLRVQLFSMALIGVRERETVPSRIYSYFCFYSLLIMNLSMVLFAVQHFGDMVLVCDCLGPGFTTYLGMVKQHYLSEQWKQLWEIIYALKKLKQIGIVSSDAAFGGLASNLVVHFKFIQAGFRDRTFEDNDQSLEDLIEYHRHVQELSRKLISAYRLIMLNNFIVASFLLCRL
ncbi:hypothetical protein pipiens_006090 [Culex pipiens pipiens]|uniref:Uncharacterized protein n=1 Tax=Culex pipiens pipiens TaxID=38569 RepID=A0ABD1DRS6_CULPP